MAKKMLGKVVAGAALGGASLLVFTPGIAFADGHHHDGEDRDGKVYAKPHIVRAGDEVKLLEICSEPQEHAYVWSKVTGKVDLKPVHEDRGDHGEDRGDWKDEDSRDYGKGEDGKGEDYGKSTDSKGEDYGKSEDGKGEDYGKSTDSKSEDYGKSTDSKSEDYGKSTDSKSEDYGKSTDSKSEDYGKSEEKGPQLSTGGQQGTGQGGGFAAADQGPGGDEYGPDAKGHDEYGQDPKSHDEAGYGEDEGGWEHKRDFVYYGEAEVSKDARPGRYELNGSCGEGELVVLPKGGVDGGDGGMTTTSTDRGMATGGASMIGAAALGGIVLMRRRRANGLV